MCGSAGGARADSETEGSTRRCRARHLSIDVVDACLWHRGSDVGLDGSKV